MTAVWLHGAGLSRRTWDEERLGGGLALDLPGHGARPRAGQASVEAFAAAILPDCPPVFDLVGHSLGGMVAIVLAATEPRRVRRLVLAETPIGSRWHPIREGGKVLARALAGVAGPRTLARLAGLTAGGATGRALEEELGAMSPDGLRDATLAATRFRGEGYAERIEAPTLVLIGADNRLADRQARRATRAIRGARLETLPGGHMLHTAAPDAFYGRVARFLEHGE